MKNNDLNFLIEIYDSDAGDAFHHFVKVLIYTTIDTAAKDCISQNLSEVTKSLAKLKEKLKAKGLDEKYCRFLPENEDLPIWIPEFMHFYWNQCRSI
jgi:hypothetical protein